MGRPLSKQFFGNRNVGGSGEGIASISWSTLGAFQGNSNVQVLTAIPALPAPTIPGGVQATWSVLFEVESVFTGSGKTNLAVGDTFGVASIPGMIAKVTDVSGANAIWSVTTTGAARGDALALADIPQDTVGITLTKIAGSGTANTFLVDILFRVASVSITEPGSGYDGTETFTFAKPGTTVGTVPAGTIVLTTGAENAIVIRANTSGAGTAVGDIVKQVSTRRYKVTTADGTGIVQLGTDDTPESGFGYIVATAEGAGPNTYYVTKLTRHKATLVTKAGDGALNGQAVQWGFSSPSGSIVQIENV
jgi:hypothetical protein